MEEKEIETLNEEKQEKIEIVEHVESKYDDLKPRTEMADFSKEERHELKEKVLEEKKEEVVSDITEKSKKKPNKFVSILICVLITILIFTAIIWIMWPTIKESTKYSDCFGTTNTSK